MGRWTGRLCVTYPSVADDVRLVRIDGTSVVHRHHLRAPAVVVPLDARVAAVRRPAPVAARVAAGAAAAVAAVVVA